MNENKLTREVTCDICGCPYMAPVYDIPECTSIYDGDSIYVRKQVAGGVKIFKCNICPFCSSDVLKYVESLKEKHERYLNERKM